MGLLFVSSTVSLSVPFCIGYVIDLINTAAKEGQMRQKLNTICSVLVVVFLVGGLANFGRVYLMQISGMVKDDFSLCYMFCTITFMLVYDPQYR